jgi:hypothetical protein
MTTVTGQTAWLGIQCAARGWGLSPTTGERRLVGSAPNFLTQGATFGFADALAAAANTLSVVGTKKVAIVAAQQSVGFHSNIESSMPRYELELLVAAPFASG